MRSRHLALSALLFVACVGVPALSVAAESPASESFLIEGGTLNAGGRPENGQGASSASFRLTIDAIAGPAAHATMSSASFSADGGFASSFPPAGEVEGLRFGDAVTLLWSTEPSAMSYRAYRDDLVALGGPAGSCLGTGIVGTSTTDAAVPDAGNGFLYLVTAVDRLAEEGTAGSTSSGDPRALASTCP